ncbi:MAG: hypothetical protein QJR06_04550 [Alicyclobacillaceae bacterium]|nr:hypothetical protein [Alicyclobacillaceae bacterium]
MSATAWVALGAAVLSAGLAAAIAKRWRERGGVHHLWWSVSLLLYTAAALAEWYALVWGWNSWIYKGYYFTAIALVAFMAAGEVYLLAGNRWGTAFAVYVLAVSAVFLAHLWWIGPLDMEAYRGVGTAIGGDAMPPPVRRWYPLLLSMIGGMVLIAGPLWSWWKRRIAANLYIALGAVILSAAGSAAKSGYPALLPLSELVGIAVIWWGFWRSTGPRGET